MKMIVAGIAVIAALVLVGSGQWPLSNFGADSGIPEPIVIRTTIQELAGLIYIAEDGGFFTQNGLNVTIHYSDTGSGMCEWYGKWGGGGSGFGRVPGCRSCAKTREYQCNRQHR